VLEGEAGQLPTSHDTLWDIGRLKAGDAGHLAQPAGAQASVVDGQHGCETGIDVQAFKQ